MENDQKDHGAGLIHQAIPEFAETLPRPTSDWITATRELLTDIATGDGREQLENLTMSKDELDALFDNESIPFEITGAQMRRVLQALGCYPVTALAKCDEPVKPEAAPMRNAESPSGVQALGSSGPSPSTCPNRSTCREACEDVDGLSYCLRCGVWGGCRR